MSTKENVKGFQHLGLPVFDIEASKKWYCENLGFEVIHETKLPEGSGETKVAFLKLNDFVLEMYQPDKVQLDEIKKRGHGHIDHLAFDVDDIEAVAQKLKKAGIKTIEGSPKYLPFWKDGVEFFNVLGPNNEKIEFCQKLKR